MSEIDMEENENREDQLANGEQVPLANGEQVPLENGEQVPENNLIDSEIEHQQEKTPSAAIPDDHSPSELKPEDDISREEVAEDEEIPVENGDVDQEIWNDEQEPMKDEYLVEEEEKSVDVPHEPDNDQDDSENTEVMGNGIEAADAVSENQQDPVTPNSLARDSNANTDDDRRGMSNNWLESEMMEDDEDGSPEEQAAFMNELDCFYRERGIDFKPPKFYQQPLNCLKLWRAVVKLGGYDLVTGTKLWRQVGISFHPPKTCTTVSWTFRNFYEKALLEYERYKVHTGEIHFSTAALPESSSANNDTNGYQGPGLSGSRGRRDAASRAMQGWHVQKLFEAGGPSIQDKNFNNMPKREKSLKSIGSVKHKRTGEMEHTVKAARTELGKQSVITIEDVGPPAEWVKINVREAEDCYEVYALVPGLLREEVRVQSDPVGRLVITGQPEQPDNPWGITAFRKVVNLPGRIDPLQTSAVVSLHGRLYVHVPFEEPDIS